VVDLEFFWDCLNELKFQFKDGKRFKEQREYLRNVKYQADDQATLMGLDSFEIDYALISEHVTGTLPNGIAFSEGDKLRIFGTLENIEFRDKWVKGHFIYTEPPLKNIVREILLKGHVKMTLFEVLHEHDLKRNMIM